MASVLFCCQATTADTAADAARLQALEQELRRAKEEERRQQATLDDLQRRRAALMLAYMDWISDHSHIVLEKPSSFRTCTNMLVRDYMNFLREFVQARRSAEEARARRRAVEYEYRALQLGPESIQVPQQ